MSRDADAENAVRRYTLCAIRNKTNSGPGLKAKTRNAKSAFEPMIPWDAALLILPCAPRTVIEE